MREGKGGGGGGGMCERERERERERGGGGGGGRDLNKLTSISIKKMPFAIFQKVLLFFFHQRVA